MPFIKKKVFFKKIIDFFFKLRILCLDTWNNMYQIGCEKLCNYTGIGIDC